MIGSSAAGSLTGPSPSPPCAPCAAACAAAARGGGSPLAGLPPVSAGPRTAPAAALVAVATTAPSTSSTSLLPFFFAGLAPSPSGDFASSSTIVLGSQLLALDVLQFLEHLVGGG